MQLITIIICITFFSWIELIKDEKMKSKFEARVTVRAVSVSRQTPPRARWGSTPIPFDITGRTGDELSVQRRFAIKKSSGEDYTLQRISITFAGL